MSDIGKIAAESFNVMNKDLDIPINEKLYNGIYEVRFITENLTNGGVYNNKKMPSDIITKDIEALKCYDTKV